MSNEINLITALCEALGFEVEQSLDYKDRKIDIPQINMDVILSMTKNGVSINSTNGEYDIDKDGLYTISSINPEITYKLIKAPTGEER